MDNLKNTFYNLPFSHIYVEEEALCSPLAQKLIKKTAPIVIHHYMDIFGRTHQNFSIQKESPALILAVKHGNFIYPGANVCQSFGNSYFYYTSFAMNCPFHCEYCYLQGMYPSANIVLFVNTEDYLKELAQLLCQHSVYLCISYDTDLLALEYLTGFLEHYLCFAAKEPKLVTELRTKSSVLPSFLFSLPEELKHRLIFAYTLSPQEVTERYEHKTAPLSARFSAIRSAGSAGFPIRLCFDPLLRIPNFEHIYGNFISQVHAALSDIPIQDASIGVFRVSDSYLKQMRKNLPESGLLQYPFENTQHVCHYGTHSSEMISFVKQQLSNWIPEEKIDTLDL